MAALELPAVFPVKAKTFRLAHKQQVTPSGAGFIQTIDRANPMWLCEYETPPLASVFDYAQVTTILEQLEGTMNTFLGYDPKRSKPLANILNHTPAPTGVTITAMSWSASTVTLDGLGSNVLNIGDYISYQYGNIWRLYKLTASRIGNGSVTVMPRPIEHTGLPLTVRLNRPAAEFKMVGDYSEEDRVDSFPVIKFSGVQFINRAT